MIEVSQNGIRVGEMALLMAETSIGKSTLLSSRDKIEQHLIQQKAQALGGPVGESCMYRGHGFTMCAAGCLIPDHKYLKDMEGETVLTLTQRWPDVLPKDIEVEEMREWQRYHDSYLIFRDGERFSYSSWIEGKEGHHPSKVKEAMVKYYGVAPINVTEESV